MNITTHLLRGMGHRSGMGGPHGTGSLGQNPMPAERSGTHTTTTARTRALTPEMIEQIIARQPDRYS